MAVGINSGVDVDTTTVGSSTEGAASVTAVSWTDPQAQRKEVRISKKLRLSRDKVRFGMCLLYPLFRQAMRVYLSSSAPFAKHLVNAISQS